jgi:hypothetical protein
MTSNEIRQVIGMKPADDPRADQLVNSNMPQPAGGYPMEEEVPYEETGYEDGAGMENY